MLSKMLRNIKLIPIRCVCAASVVADGSWVEQLIFSLNKMILLSKVLSVVCSRHQCLLTNICIHPKISGSLTWVSMDPILNGWHQSFNVMPATGLTSKMTISFSQERFQMKSWRSILHLSCSRVSSTSLEIPTRIGLLDSRPMVGLPVWVKCLELLMDTMEWNGAPQRPRSSTTNREKHSMCLLLEDD